MGLLEKRAVKAFQDGPYKKSVDEINALAGYPIEFDVNWNSLAVDEYSHMYEEAYTKVFFMPIVAAIKEITVDDMGKDALKETLKKIVIKNENGNYSGSSAYSLSSGTLTIDHQPITNIDDINNRSKELTSLLMKQM